MTNHGGAHEHTARSHTPGVIQHAHGYDLFAAVLFGGRRRQVYRRLAVESGAGPGDRVLDVGCGTGYFTRVMAEAVTPGGTAAGVDPSPEMVAQAWRLARLENCSFSQGVAEALDEADATYDVVVSSLMIHHLPEALRDDAITEMFRVLRPGGSLLVADFRPPASRVGRRLAALMSHVMSHNPVDLLEPMARDAGFEHTRTGDVRPWIHFVHAVKPGPAGPNLG